MLWPGGNVCNAFITAQTGFLQEINRILQSLTVNACLCILVKLILEVVNFEKETLKNLIMNS